ncbi:MAG: PAS domain-containing protein [Notoacmeibacter sp.]|nr:PAS domain-containing protein [Notoacmeibacter sp.]
MTRPPSSVALSRRGGVAVADGTDEMWIDVIRKMDEVYAELVESQAELELKNTRLEEAYAFIGSVLESMADVVIVCDGAGIIQQVNGTLEDITGRTGDELRGAALSSIFQPASQAVVSGFMNRLRAGETISQCEVSVAAHTDELSAISVNCSPRTGQGGRIDGMVIVGRPIGELQRAYRQLNDAHRQLSQTQQQLLISEKMAALGRLVAGVAHELNNPISFVYGNMYALKRYGATIVEYLKSCEKRLSLEEMQALRAELKIDRLLADIEPLVNGTLEGVERVSDIVQDLRRFSSNQQESEEQFNAVRLIRTAADWVIKTQRVKPNVRFEMPDRLEVRGRKGQLHQIIVNLVQNAADALASRPDGEIVVSCARQGRDVVIKVADNATGIPAAHIDKIFEPFFTTKPIGTGTGLGLYVSYSMAMKQGGDLTAANRPEGGAEFTLRIPEGISNDDGR